MGEVEKREDVRVLHILPDTEMGGAQQQASLLLAALRAQGAEVHLVVLDRAGELHSRFESCASVVCLGRSRRGIDATTVRQLAREIRTFEPDVVHSWQFVGNTYARIASILCPGVPLVSSERGFDLLSPHTSRSTDLAIRLGNRVLSRASSRILANSKALCQHLIDLGCPEDRIRVIHNGMPDRRCEDEGEVRRTRDRLTPGTDRVLVGTVARITRDKNLEDFVRSAVLIRKDLPEAAFVIQGNGDGTYLAELREMIRTNDLEDAVHLIPADGADPIELLQALDLFLLTSHSESFPNTVMEAMCVGTPVVAADVGGVGELVTDGSHGRLVARGRPDQIAAAAVELLRNAESAAALSAAARARVLSDFSVEAMTRKHRGVYHEVIANRMRQL